MSRQPNFTGTQFGHYIFKIQSEILLEAENAQREKKAEEKTHLAAAAQAGAAAASAGAVTKSVPYYRVRFMDARGSTCLGGQDCYSPDDFPKEVVNKILLDLEKLLEYKGFFVANPDKIYLIVEFQNTLGKKNAFRRYVNINFRDAYYSPRTDLEKSERYGFYVYDLIEKRLLSNQEALDAGAAAARAPAQEPESDFQQNSAAALPQPLAARAAPAPILVSAVNWQQLPARQTPPLPSVRADLVSLRGSAGSAPLSAASRIAAPPLSSLPKRLAPIPGAAVVVAPMPTLVSPLVMRPVISGFQYSPAAQAAAALRNTAGSAPPIPATASAALPPIRMAPRQPISPSLRQAAGSAPAVAAAHHSMAAPQPVRQQSAPPAMSWDQMMYVEEVLQTYWETRDEVNEAARRAAYSASPLVPLPPLSRARSAPPSSAAAMVNEPAFIKAMQTVDQRRAELAAGLQRPMAPTPAASPVEVKAAATGGAAAVEQFPRVATPQPAVERAAQPASPLGRNRAILMPTPAAHAVRREQAQQAVTSKGSTAAKSQFCVVS